MQILVCVFGNIKSMNNIIFIFEFEFQYLLIVRYSYSSVIIMSYNILQGVCEKVVILVLNFGNKKIFKYKKNYRFRIYITGLLGISTVSWSNQIIFYDYVSIKIQQEILPTINSTIARSGCLPENNAPGLQPFLDHSEAGICEEVQHMWETKE